MSENRPVLKNRTSRSVFAKLRICLINKPDASRRIKEMAVKLFQALNKPPQATEECKSFAEAALLVPCVKRHGFLESQCFEKQKSLVSNCKKSKYANGMLETSVPAGTQECSRVCNENVGSVHDIACCGPCRTNCTRLLILSSVL
jgi:hypothetical protein